MLHFIKKKTRKKITIVIIIIYSWSEEAMKQQHNVEIADSGWLEPDHGGKYKSATAGRHSSL
jgi:hypothetical protein